MSDKLAEVAPNGAIPVVQADGKVGYLPAALANDPAATEGLRRATDTQIRGAQVAANQAATKAALDAQFSGSIGAELEGAVAPALAGAARGLTLGGSDALLSDIGPGVRRRLLDYQDYAPITSTVGEIGAIAGAALLGDEAGLGALPNAVGRLGARAGAGAAEALGGGMLARGAGVLARGAVEGGVYGAGQKVSEAALHDTPLTGEALIAGTAHGAAGGMIASGLLHGAGFGLGKLRGAFRPNAQAYEAIAAREFGEAAPGIGKKLAGEVGEVVDPATAGGAYRAPSAVAPVEAAERNAADAAGEAYIKQAGGKHKSELGEIWKNREVAFQDGAERIEQHSRDLQRAITEQQTAAKAVDMQTFGDAKVNHMTKLVDRSKFEEQAGEVMNWMFKANDAVKLSATDTAVTKLSPAARREFDGQMARLGKAIESGDSVTLHKATDDAKRFLGRFSGFGNPRGPSTEAEKMFNALYQDDGGLMHVLESPVWGEAASAAQKKVNAAITQNIAFGQRFRQGFVTGHGAEGGVPTTQGNSEKVSSFLGRLTKAANDNDAQAVREFIETRRKFLDATSESYDHGGAARTAIGKERAALDQMEATFKKATEETSLINQAKRLQAEEQAQKIGGMVGVVTDTLSKPITTLQRLAQIEQHTKSVLDKVGLGTKRLAGDAGSGATVAQPKAPATELAPPKGAGKGFFSLLLDRGGASAERAAVVGAGRASFDKRAEALAGLQANPAALSARVGEALGPFAATAPKASQAATATAMAGLTFLASKMPPNRRDPFTLQPQLQRTMRASDTEIAQHMRYQEALDNPAIVLEQAHKGTLTPDAVEAVKTVYPALYDHMRTQLFQELVNSKSELPYGRRIQLGILLELPTDQTLAPDFVSAIQATYAASDEARAEPPPSKLAALDVAASSMTATQAASGNLDR